MADLWVENRHPDYGVEVLRREYTRDQYTGRALDVSKAEANSANNEVDSNGPRKTSNFMNEDNLPRGTFRVGYLSEGGTYAPSANGGYGTYLIQRSQGESASAFAERARITRFPSHMPALIDAYVGGIAAVEGGGKWQLSEEGPLGEHDNPSDVMSRIWNDIDGTGRNYLGALNTTKANLVVDDKFFSFAYMPEGADRPFVDIIDPNRIVDWHFSDGILNWLLVAEDVLERPDVHEPAIMVRYYTEYSLEGWVRYRVEDGGEAEPTLEVVDGDEWKHKFYTDATKTRERLPFTYLRFSDMLGREVGYQMAQDHNALYNLLSDARWNFRVINHPRLVGDVEDGVFKKGVEGINAGANGLQGKWAYISPDSSNAAQAYNTYEQEVRQFYVTNHQRMNSSIERSATEALLNQAEGRTAFLSLMASAIDEIDNDWRFLMSQIMSPGDPSSWHSSHVVRSRDFKPVDVEALAQKHVINFVSAIGTGLPPDTAALMATEGINKEVMDRLKEEDIIPPPPPPPEADVEDDGEEQEDNE